jgi:vacuolar protein 8
MGNVYSTCCGKRSRDGLYDNALAESEREAVAELLGYLENVRLEPTTDPIKHSHLPQRAEVDFFTGPPLQALSTLVYSDNLDLQRSASLTFAEITERGMTGR